MASGIFEGQCLSGSHRCAVTGRACVKLEEQCLAGHFRMARKSAAPTKGQKVLPCQSPLSRIIHEISAVAHLCVLNLQRFVQYRQCTVDQWVGMPRHEDKPVAEAFPRLTDVPSHDAGKQGGDHGIDF